MKGLKIAGAGASMAGDSVERRAHPTAPSSRSCAKGLLVCALLVCCFATLPSNASAGTYFVAFCAGQIEGPSGGTGLSIANDPPQSVNVVTENHCARQEQPELFQSIPLETLNIFEGHGKRWTFTAPDNTTIALTTLNVQFSGIGTSTEWEVKNSNGTRLDYATHPVPGSGGRFYAVNAQGISARISCMDTEFNLNCNFGPNAIVRVTNPIAQIRDNFAPSVYFDDLFARGKRFRDTIGVPYHATDLGGGVADAEIIVDGSQHVLVHDANSGRCVKPPNSTAFRFAQPCSLSVDSTLPLNTTKFADGPHQVQVAVYDAGREKSVSEPVTIIVHNRPAAIEVPFLSGLSNRGELLEASTGEWEGEPTTFSYQWLRCPAGIALGDATGCTEIPGATKARYQLVAADVGKRAVARVTAVNQFGTEAALSVPSAVVDGDPDLPPPIAADRTPPVLSGVALSRSRFLIGKKPTAVASAARPARGTALKFQSSEAGVLSIRIDKLRRKTKAVTEVATLTRKIAAGRGRVELSGRIKSKPLAAGIYRLTVIARDAAGNPSTASRLKMTILRG